MRKFVLFLLVVALAVVPQAVGGSRAPGAGPLSIENGRGVIVIKGRGVIVGKVARGRIQIVDLTPNDRWSPVVNGKVKGAQFYSAPTEVVTNFRVVGGAFRIVIRGEGVSIAAVGKGVAQLDGEPDATGSAGVYGTQEGADCVSLPESCSPIGDQSLRVEFGGNAAASSGGATSTGVDAGDPGKRR